MQATWSQPVADVVVFSNDLASRRQRPRRPCATSTRQAWRMGRNSGCLSSHPTRRTSKPCRRPSFAAAPAVSPRSTSTSSSRPVTPRSARCSRMAWAAWFLVYRGGYHQLGHGEAGDVHRDNPLGALGPAVRAPAVMEGHPAVGGAAGQVRVDDQHRRHHLRPPFSLAGGGVQHRQRPRPGAVARPAPERRPHPGPAPERLRQVPPLAAGLRDVQHRVHHRAQVLSVLASPLAGRVDHRLQQRPLLIGQIIWIRHAGHCDDHQRSGNRDTPS
jgi:hypothetical protein